MGLVRAVHLPGWDEDEGGQTPRQVPLSLTPGAQLDPKVPHHGCGNTYTNTNTNTYTYTNKQIQEQMLLTPWTYQHIRALRRQDLTYVPTFES